MAHENNVTVWFRRSDGEEICANEGSEACKHMRRESDFEEVSDPTVPALPPASLAPAVTPSKGAGKAARAKGTPSKGAGDA